jgi:hypothetical protein
MEHVLPIFWHIVMQLVSPHTNEARVGNGTGVEVGRGGCTTMPDVGRTAGTVEVGTTPPDAAVGAAVGTLAAAVGAGVPVRDASPFFSS